MEGDLSIITTLCPVLAISRAAWMPAIPPPITIAVFVTGTFIGWRAELSFTFSTCVLTISTAFLVVRSFFSCTQEQCSLRFAISQRNGFNPASEHAFLKVGSCILGEHAATTTPVRLCSLTASLIRVWPGSEHMYL